MAKLPAGVLIESELGSGGFACVWKASRSPGDSPVALKIGHAAGALVRARFAREAVALAAVGPPHVPALYEHGALDDGRPFLMMEYVDGAPLSRLLLSRPGPRDMGWVAAVCNALLGNLAGVHDRDIAHLDVKPENIMISEATPGAAAGLRSRLVDLGMCRLLRTASEKELPEHELVIGSIEFMAPEQVAGEVEVTAAADIYAFGVILYLLITGRLPFAGERDEVARGHMSLRPPRPGALASVPAGVEALCLACLHKKPEKRPAGARGLRDELLRALRSEVSGPVARPERSPEVKLLAGACQPVVLMAAEGALPQTAVVAAASRHKGFVVRRKGQRYICAFSSARSETPLGDALAAARELRTQHGARLTLHVADVTLRPGRAGGAPRVYGAAVEEPESWLPDAPWSEIYFTPEAAAVLPDATVPAPGDPRFQVLLSAAEPSSTQVPVDSAVLVGRNRDIERARRSARACFAEKTPGLFTILGEHGLGKTRLCGELGRMIREEFSGVTVVEIRAVKQTAGQGPGARDATWLALAEGLEASFPENVSTAPMEQPASVPGFGDRLRRQASVGPVALIIDDIHYASAAVLDVIEYATLDGEEVPLWIAVAGLPRVERRRPQWGSHALRHERVVLKPLVEAQAMELAVALLRPAEYPPPATLKQLAGWTGGNPYLLTALVSTLKRAGAVRQGRQPGSWYVATEELAHLPALPVGQWLAERALSRLSPELAACARVCAVLGSELSRDALAWVLHTADLTQAATTSIDADVGLAELATHRILVHVRGDVWAFREVLFQDGIYKLIAPADRAAIHRSALGFWRSRAAGDDSERALSAIARHAEASAEPDIAAGACLELGDRARREHRHVDADAHYTRALELIGPKRSHELLRALQGRGKVRYRLQRIHESIEDLRCARHHAEILGHLPAIASLCLEESTALDWAGKYEDSAALVERAGALMADSRDRRLYCRYLMAWGRSRYREERLAEAVDALTRARRLAQEIDDCETGIVALLLLGPMRVQRDELDDAEACFDEVIALCRRTDDRFHLCVAYLNRAWLWLARKRLESAMDDLSRAQTLARELGQPILERGAAHNLAEFLHWSGRHDLARRPAQRAYALQRFLPDPVAKGALLLGRVLTACDELEDARRLVAAARFLLYSDGREARAGSESTSGGQRPPGHDELALRMLEVTLADAAGESVAAAWDELIATAETCLPPEEFLEIIYFRVRMALRRGRRDEAAQLLDGFAEKLDRSPLWRPAFAMLTAAANA